MTELVGVGDCPERADGLGHVWQSWKVDARRSCEFCGRPGRDNVWLGESGGYFAEATMARHDLSDTVKAPMESGSGSPAKAWGAKGMPPAMQAKAAEIVADKKRRDAVMVADGTARPGQLAGAPKGARS